MYHEAQGKDGDHDIHNGCGHKVAAQLEKAVPFREQYFVICSNAVLAGEGVYHREEIDGGVKQ